jgi:hypothetical protein
MSLTEILGFITGATNVWLLAGRTFELAGGLANNGLYVAVFLAAGFMATLGSSWSTSRWGFMGGGLGRIRGARVGGQPDAEDHVDLATAGDGRCGRWGSHFLPEALSRIRRFRAGTASLRRIVARCDSWGADQEVCGIVVAVGSRLT